MRGVKAESSGINHDIRKRKGPRRQRILYWGPIGTLTSKD